jgi:drug/metabolite transporter (DMT)-like permease
MRKQRLLADLVLLLVALIWGISIVLQHIAAAEVQAYVFNGVRFLLGVIVILPFAIHEALGNAVLDGDPSSVEAVSLVRLLPVKYLPGVLLAGLLLAAGSAFQQIGMKYTTASNAGFITGLYVVLLPIFLTFGGLRKAPRPLVWIAAILSACGLFLLSTNGHYRVNRGDLLVMAGSVFWALHVILIGWMVRRVRVLQIAVGQSLVCGLASLIVGLYLEPQALQLMVSYWWLLAYTGIIAVGVGFTFQAVGQRMAPPADTAIILSMESVFAAIGGWLFLAESLTPLQVLGGGIILLGMMLAQSDVILGKRLA